MGEVQVEVVEFANHPIDQWTGEEWQGGTLQPSHLDAATGKAHVIVTGGPGTESEDQHSGEFDADELLAHFREIGKPPNPYMTSRA
jgi:hypothetical protein